jgi:hypothetical protein
MKRERIVALVVILAFLTIAARLVPGMKNLTTTYEHHEAHQGNVYSSVNNQSRDNGEKILLLVNTTNAEHAHMMIELRSSGEANIEVWEDTSTSAAGTAMEETNHNRDSSNTASTSVFLTPTIASAGDKLDGLSAHTGSGQRIGGEARGAVEIILDEDSLYLINGISEANSNDMTITLRWYESSDYY